MLLVFILVNWYHYSPQFRDQEKIKNISLNDRYNDEGLALVEGKKSPFHLHILRVRGWIASRDKIYDIKLPNPDYHIELNIKGFKKVLAQSTAVEDLFLYGSFINFKIYQPELNKYYFDETLRGVTQVKIPKEQSDINDWRKYYYNLEILFDDFSKNIIKQDKKWLKKATKKKIKKEIKNLNLIIDKLK